MLMLIRHDRPVATMFDLLGSLENDITDSLGFTLSRSSVFCQLLLADLGFVDPIDQADVTIGVQNHRSGQGITDLEIRVGDRYFAIFEAKSGAAIPSEAQLSMYAAVLMDQDASYKQLVAITNATQPAAVAGLQLMDLPDVPLTHRSWREVRQVAVSARTAESRNGAKVVLDDFIDYLGGILGMENKFDNRVYVVSLGAGRPEGWALSWIDIIEKRNRYFYPAAAKGWPAPPNYLGFRYGGQLQSIHHVDSIEVIENFRDVFPEAPDVAIPPHYCFELGPAIVPYQTVKNGPRVQRSNRVWCMLDTLLTSATISDALDETDRRTSEA